MNEFRAHELATQVVRGGGSDVFPDPGTAIDIIGRALSKAYLLGVDNGARTASELEGI